MPKIKLVALIVDATRPYHRKIIPGVADYAREVGNWRLYLEEGVKEKLPDFRAWRGSGVILTFDDRAAIEAVGKLAIPVVGLERIDWSDTRGDIVSRIPCFRTDNRAIGRLGAEHLMDQGFTRLAYCGFPKSPLTMYSLERAEAFRQRAEEAGCSCWAFTGRHLFARRWLDVQRELTRWLSSLEKPFGLMACNDARARHVLEACWAIGARMPDDVAVIGVDNDEILCEVTHPPLSSIEQGARRLGYRAAAMLDQLMAGKKPPQMDIFIEPDGVVKRRSTDALAVEDPDVVSAVRFIREHAFDGIQIADVVEFLQVSRSTLEMKFKAAMGRTMHAEIRRARLERAKDLAANTDLSLKQVAARSGYAHVQHMTNIFRRHLDQTPGEYRRRSRR